MSARDQEPIFVRIIEIPPVRMARSGGKELEAFDKWWSDLADRDRYSLSPRDFMWFNPQLENLEWLYALPAGFDDTGGYETFDFPGGLYAVTACKDVEDVIERTSKLLHEWVEHSDIFVESSQTNDPLYPRYEMGHVITPKNAKEMFGYHQMDLFVPVVLRKG